MEITFIDKGKKFVKRGGMSVQCLCKTTLGFRKDKLNTQRKRVGREGEGCRPLTGLKDYRMECPSEPGSGI